LKTKTKQAKRQKANLQYSYYLNPTVVLYQHPSVFKKKEEEEEGEKEINLYIYSR
jgi:hypothetical protein